MKHLPTISEVAELLQLPVSWVYSNTRSGARDRIPGFRLGKYWRLPPACVFNIDTLSGKTVRQQERNETTKRI
jgi:hypothetical protein